MRLLYVTPPATAGGVSRSAERMITAMREASHSVLHVRPDPHLFLGDQREDVVGDGPGLLRFGMSEPAEPTTWVGTIAAAAERFRPQLIVGYYGSSAGYAAVQAGATTAVPVVLCLRGNDVDRDRHDPHRAALLTSAVQGANAVVAVSRAMAATVGRSFGRSAHFISNSVDRDRFFPDAAQAERFRQRHDLGAGPTIGLFGVFKPKRGLDRLAEVADALAHWQLLLVGELRPRLRHLLSPAWRHIGFIDDDAELRGAYCACDLVLQPSHDDGMPNVLLEAMACGRSVVASRVGGIIDLVRDGVTGLLFDSTEQLGEILESLHQAPRPELGLAARLQVPTVEQERLAFEAVFDEVARQAPSPTSC